MKLIKQLQTANKHELSINKLQAVALLSLSERRISELAKLINITPAAMTGLIDSLQLKHIVKRNRNQFDRRIIKISLTEKGKEVANDILNNGQNTYI